MWVRSGCLLTIEIKECHADTNKPGTLNQIRAIKFIPLVVYNPARGKWYVASPVKIVSLTSEKERGQHNEIAYECANLSLSQLESDACDDEELGSRVEAACLEAEARGDLREAMHDLLCELRETASRYRERIRKLLTAS